MAGSVRSVRQAAADSVRAAVAVLATMEHPAEVGSVRPVHRAAAVTVRPVHRAAADSVPSVHSAAAAMVQPVRAVYRAVAAMVQPVRAVHRAVAATEPAARMLEPGQSLAPSELHTTRLNRSRAQDRTGTEPGASQA